jgi:hypothetical protein
MFVYTCFVWYEKFFFLQHTKYHCLKLEYFHLFKILNENTKRRDQSEDLSVDGRMILKCILEKWVGRAWIGLMWLTVGAKLAGSCERGNECVLSVYNRISYCLPAM